MNKKIKILLSNILLMCSILAFSQECPNYTHTDPNPTYVQPTNGGFKTNTFDWTGTNNTNHDIPISKPTPITSTTVKSPFFETADAWMAGIVQNAATDSKPEDGWELIKQDMGYYYDASASPPWEGVPFVTSPYENNSAAYIILYNKYQAKLRVFAILPTQGATTADVTNVTISFQSPHTNSSALFNSYNQIEQTLDQTTNIPLVSAMAIQPNTADRWIYADFPMSYDPCTCFLQSDLQVSFTAITTASLTATGRSLGTAVPISIADISSGTIGTDGVKGQNPFSDGYITSFVPAGTNGVSSLVQDFQDAQALASKFDGAQSSVNVASILSTTGQLASNIAQGVGSGFSTSDNMNAGIANAIGFGFGALGNIADYYTGSNTQSNAMPMTISSQLVLTGTLSTSTAQYGSGFFIANPGTPGAASDPEYGNFVSGATSSYPMYNQTMGLFALLTPPTVDVFRQDVQVTGAIDDCPIIDHTKNVQYQLTGGLQYAFNPIVDPVSTKIFASLQIQGFPNITINMPDDCNFNNLPVTSTDISQANQTLTNLTFVGNVDYPSGSSTVNCPEYVTPSLPIECAEGLVAENAIPTIREFGDAIGNLGSADVAGQNILLQLTIVYMFKPDEYGIVHSSTQILTYPVNIVTVTTAPSPPSGFQLVTLPFPNNLTIPATTFTGGA